MDIQALRCFLSVYEHLSFSKAARDCYVTQPVISRKIAALEEEFHCVLFRRTRQGVVPTESGKRFVDYARQMLQLYEEAGKSLSRCDGGAHSLSIAAVTPAAVGFLPRTIAKFFAAHPGVDIQLDHFTPAELQTLLPSNAYDFYITLMPDLELHKEMNVIKLLRDGVCLVTRAENAPNDLQDAVSLLQSNTIFTVSRQDSPHFHELVQRQLLQLGVEHPRIREIRPLELLTYCVSANMGVALSPKIHSKPSTGLAIYTFPKEGPQMELGIAWRQERPLMRDFLELLQDALP